MKLRASRLCYVLFTGTAFYTYARTYTHGYIHDVVAFSWAKWKKKP